MEDKDGAGDIFVFILYDWEISKVVGERNKIKLEGALEKTNCLFDFNLG